jgi:hypothetical protein
MEDREILGRINERVDEEHELCHRAGEGMRFGSLKAKYRQEYGELRAEERGQGE